MTHLHNPQPTRWHNYIAHSFTPISACIGRTYRAVLLLSLLYFFAPTTALHAQTEFITKWDLSKAGYSTTALNFYVQVGSAGAADYTWNTVPAGANGSGTIPANATSVTISGLPAGATIEVKINPTNFQRINISFGSDKARLVDVSQWGTAAWTSMAEAFKGCNNLANITATDVPNLAGVTNMSEMFSNCSVLNGPSNIGTWNTAAVTNMSFMFSRATAFNQNIGAWTTTAVTNMSDMFSYTTAFNQNIGMWNTAAVTNMASMFYAATAFNQNIGAWNITAVTPMTYMFYTATAFNQSLAAWGSKFNANVSLWNCLENSGLNVSNYEATLAGFVAGGRTNITLGAAGLKYCNATDRTTLVTPIANGGKGWTITGDEICATATFITKWDLSKTAGNSTSLTFGVQIASAGATDYTWNTVPAGTSGMGSIPANATSVTISGLPAGATIEVKINPTNFQRININGANDNARLIDISQWGITTWTSMANAFAVCNNLANITATDVPNLAGVTNMSNMFGYCSVLNGPSNIGTWNTAAVTNMSFMFSHATSFNQNIGTWNTAAVTNMSYMFYNAAAFNQNIGAWDVAAVTSMWYMFAGTTAFNQNIGTWNTTAVTNMRNMFRDATAFNQNIGTWNVAAVTDMANMFYAATAFNQNIGAWNVAAVTDMSAIFFNATAFNQSLAAWGSKFNANVSLSDCLNNSGMSVANYDATLAGFAAGGSINKNLGAAGLKYCNATDRTTLVTPIASGGKGWTISGDIKECTTDAFITRWDLSKTGASTTELTFGVQIASTGATNYIWNTVPAGTSGMGSVPANATSVTITGLPAGAIIELKISPTNFQRININGTNDYARLIDISQWGITTWTSMANAFRVCNNLANITATDVPTLTGVTDMSNMFRSCTLLNGPSNIGTWNTAAVTNMSSMFRNASAFNQNIGTWNTAAVTNMTYMFYNATAFNENIGAWNTTAVTNMSNMFYYATAFNQNISAWNTAAVTDMSAMFYYATAFNQNISTWNTAAVTNMSAMLGFTTAFNQNISTWNVAAVTNMSSMFYYAFKFNQNIDAWNVAAVTDMSYMFRYASAFNQSLAAWGTKFNSSVNLSYCLDNCGMSIANYEATLTGFAAGGRTNRVLGALNLKFCNGTDRSILITPIANGGKGWTITGDAICATATFITKWDLSKTGGNSTELTFGVQIGSAGATDYTWKTVPSGTSGSGTIPENATTATITGLPDGAMIELKISPTNFKRIYNNIDRARLIEVSQWGITAWTSMADAFNGCGNLANITATDVPNLAGVTDMSTMFRSCYLLNGPSNIGTWNTATVTNMLSTFNSATAFNQNIGAWNTAAVTNMPYMFSNAIAFNQNISSWNTAAVKDMAFMFSNATTFNQNISAWNTTAVIGMSYMFQSATAFNQNISAWNTTAAINMSYMFQSATAFNQNIGTWNVAAVTKMSNMFLGATAFNQSLAAWGSKFNTNVNLTGCLDNSGLNANNYEATLTGFVAGGRTGRTLGATGLKYCNPTDRATLVAPIASGGKGWTITDDAQDCVNKIYVGSSTCDTYTLNSVSGNTWYNIIGTTGIVASINPNGQNLGNLTIIVSDPSGSTTLANGNKFLGRNININSSAYPVGTTIPSNYSLRLYYYDTEFEEYKTAINSTTATLQDLNVAWASGGSGCDLQTYSSSATTNGAIDKANVGETDYGIAPLGGTALDGFYLSFNLNHFTVFASTTASGTPLPVELLSFTGHKDNNLHRLKWITASEQNVSHFEVQHSTTGSNFVTLGNIRAIGNSNTPQHYDFDHKNISIGIHYYRLKFVDSDGRFEYSKIIAIDTKGENAVSVFPNPSKGIFTITGIEETEEETFTLINSIGQTLSINVQNKGQFDMSAYPSGVYYLRVASSGQMMKLVKE